MRDASRGLLRCFPRYHLGSPSESPSRLSGRSWTPCAQPQCGLDRCDVEACGDLSIIALRRPVENRADGRCCFPSSLLHRVSQGAFECRIARRNRTSLVRLIGGIGSLASAVRQHKTALHAILLHPIAEKLHALDLQTDLSTRVRIVRVLCRLTIAMKSYGFPRRVTSARIAAYVEPGASIWGADHRRLDDQRSPTRHRIPAGGERGLA